MDEESALLSGASSVIRYDRAHRDETRPTFSSRHLQMIAIAGTLGTGLFVGSGQVLVRAGPLGAIAAFSLMGSIAYAMLVSLGEMSTMMPASGSYVYYAERFADPALSFALGWNVLTGGSLGLPAEITAASLITEFWTDHKVLFLIGYATLIFCTGVWKARYFAELESVFAVVKIMLIVTLIVGGLWVDVSGGTLHTEPLGFTFWRAPYTLFKPFIKDGALGCVMGVFSMLTTCGYAYSGIEWLTLAGNETKNAPHALNRAISNVFYRIAGFYILGAFVIGLTVASDDKRLLQADKEGATSPFVLALERTGLQFVSSLVNAGVLTATLSAANSQLFAASRTLYGMSLNGHAPKIFLKVNAAGLPWVAVVAPGLFLFAALASLSQGAAAVLQWIIKITAMGSFLAWGTIAVVYLRFYYGLRTQGYDPREAIPYHSRLQPYLAYWVIFWCIFIAIFGGFPNFYAEYRTWGSVISSYGNIPVFFGLFFLYKWKKRTRFLRLDQIDFEN